jgi:uncharacterized protein (TIGR02246 family)
MRRTIKSSFLACLALATLATTRLAFGQAADNSRDAAEAVRAAAKEYVEAVRRGDVEALRRMWTPDGDYVDASGRTTKAQELLRDRPDVPPSPAKPIDSAASPSSLRFITPDVAIEDGTCTVGESGSGADAASRFSAVWVKRDGRWLLDSVRESVAAIPASNDHLHSLEWLLGEWAGQSGDSVILVSSHWSEAGNYIVRDFVFSAAGDNLLTGTERIGWDPGAGKLKSWMFDSNGGSGEGHWRRDGERWIVDSEEVMPDGKKSSASTSFTPGDANHFVWEVQSAKVGDMDLPPRRVEFKRAAEKQADKQTDK